VEWKKKRKTCCRREEAAEKGFRSDRIPNGSNTHLLPQGGQREEPLGKRGVKFVVGSTEKAHLDRNTPLFSWDNRRA